MSSVFFVARGVCDRLCERLKCIISYAIKKRSEILVAFLKHSDIIDLMALFLISVILSSITLEYNNKSYEIESKGIDGFTYYNLKDVKKAIGFEVSEESASERFILKYKEKKAIFIPDNQWAVFDSTVVNSPIPPKLKNDKLWLPLPLLNKLFLHFLKLQVRQEGKKLVTREAIHTIKKIVIDPGHGGKDPGAVGLKKFYEKTAALAISKLVAELLEQELGITCILTRDKDVFIPLRKRALIANRAKADLFLSIHCNAHRSREKHGTEVYFLSPAKTTWARAVEARENASIKWETKEQRGEIESILWDLAQAQFLKEANNLAGKLVNSISKSVNTKNRGVKQANFYVLRGAYMPACLLEIEFISNPKGEKNLRSKKFQQKVAQGVLQGVREFKEWYEKSLNY